MPVSTRYEGLLRPADDDFHPRQDDPFHAEGSWWCFFHPERRLAGWIYHLTRLNLGVASGGVWIWDDSATQWYEAPYFAQQNLQPIDHRADYRDMRWPDGARIRTVEPLRRYEATYRDGDLLDLELEYRATTPPYVSATGDPPVVERFEQPCRVTGRLTLHGEKIEIDCRAMFDHSWGSRPERTPLPQKVGRLADHQAPYLWGAASDDDAFFVMAGAGVLTLGGVRADIPAVRQQIERDPVTGAIRTMRLTGIDARGRAFEASGAPQNLIVRPSNGASVAFIYTMEWRLNGLAALGDVQDVLPSALWSAYRRRSQ